jgi:hypothetical protein
VDLVVDKRQGCYTVVVETNIVIAQIIIFAKERLHLLNETDYYVLNRTNASDTSFQMLLKMQQPRNRFELKVSTSTSR